jgi:hypothetical protein
MFLLEPKSKHTRVACDAEKASKPLFVNIIQPYPQLTTTLHRMETLIHEDPKPDTKA